MRVLHLPMSVGGNAWGLSQAEKTLGIYSQVLVEENNWLNYESDICLKLQGRNKYYKAFRKFYEFLKNTKQI